MVSIFKIFYTQNMSILAIVLNFGIFYTLFFVCVLATNNSVLVQFRIILSAIVSLANLKVLYSRVSLGKSNI